MNVYSRDTTRARAFLSAHADAPALPACLELAASQRFREDRRDPVWTILPLSVVLCLLLSRSAVSLLPDFVARLDGSAGVVATGQIVTPWL
jgi:hypothetical protein